MQEGTCTQCEFGCICLHPRGVLGSGNRGGDDDYRHSSWNCKPSSCPFERVSHSSLCKKPKKEKFLIHSSAQAEAGGSMRVTAFPIIDGLQARQPGSLTPCSGVESWWPVIRRTMSLCDLRCHCAPWGRFGSQT